MTNITQIIETIEASLAQVQEQLDELKVYTPELSARTVMLTRQEAADYVGESLRQLDRDCVRYGIEKVQTIGGIRIRKADLMRCMGLLRCGVPDLSEIKPQSEKSRISDYERLTSKYHQSK